MLTQNYGTIVFALSLMGSLFALYMSLYTFTQKMCPFNEKCPRFLGYSACYYGFAMFFIMFVASAMALGGSLAVQMLRQILSVVSLMGMVFSGRYIVGDVREWLVAKRRYGLILPSCAYGFIFYTLIFIVSVL